MSEKQASGPERRKSGAPASRKGDMGEGSFSQSTDGDKPAPSRQGPKRVKIPDEDRLR